MNYYFVLGKASIVVKYMALSPVSEPPEGAVEVAQEQYFQVSGGTGQFAYKDGQVTPA